MTEEHDHSHYHGVDKAEEHVSVSEALSMLLENIKPVKQETVDTLKSNNRVVSDDVTSPTNLPKRARSTRDGYAVNISQDAAAGLSFKVIGSIRIGKIPNMSIASGEAARVATGSYLPTGANAVVMIEYVEVKDQNILVNREIKIHQNILDVGEDIGEKELLLSKGSRIHPQHVALFSMLGIKRVKVFARPKIAFFSTGDELVDPSKPNSKIGTGVYDATRPFISSMISNLGGIPIDLRIARDNFTQTRAKMVKGLKSDALILSAGSSVGERDYVTKAANSIKGVKILEHGIAMRPSSPTGLASYRGKPLLLLPGFPTSAMISFFVFAVPSILRLSGSVETRPITIKAKLNEDYAGKTGITHYVRVKVVRVNGEYRAEVIRPTDAHYSNWLRAANGIAVIDENGSAKRDELVEIFPIAEIS